MFRSATRQGLFVLIILSVQLGAQDAGEVYSQDIKAPDFLASWIEPLFKPGPSGLYLTGWTSGLVPADTTDEQAEELPPELHLSARQASQVMRHFPAMLKLNLTPLKRAVLVDPQSHLISIALEHDQTPVSLPSTTSLVSYITRRVSYNVQTLARDKLSAALISSEAAALNRTRSIELLGADIGGQRVSLKVAGNVTINGGVKFKEQEKSVTNFRAGSNWDLDVNQTQRFDITGSVGDRIDVTIHQDSENIFEWENAMKIAYKGDEDEILQTIDAGNISLSLPGTQFATGGSGSSKGLFGIKAVSKLGPLNITTIASIERSQKSTKSNQLSEALVIQDRLYLRNKYFFIDTEFRRRYYPLTKNGRHTVYGDRVIKQLEVYLSSSRIAQVNLADTYTGTAFINPPAPTDTVTSVDAVAGQFRRLELNVDYVPDYELGVIRMVSSAQND
ncbi:MAG: hypothetical protein IID15_03155, partial [Candidatus Marinimicrobia bacterium]|nr:hypothetical protein [Candidatus Neomarinimicrobiota bacterium]